MNTAPRPRAIYSTWGLHDELGDTVHLTETLATAAFEELLRWRDRFGIRTDVFHIDCMWFDPARGLDHFHPAHWPNGFEPLRRRILAEGMKPGLWYSANGSWLKPAAWSDSWSSNHWHHSLFEGSFAAQFEASLLRAARDWGVRFFKFDFAQFESATAACGLATEVRYQRGFARFVAMLEKLRSEFPDVEMITHCGFARGRLDQARPLETTVLPPAVDPSLLGVVDRVFSADPHVFDVPCSDITRAVDLHQDRQVWHLHRAGFPLHRIDDHGAVMATTNTGHYRGRAGFLRTHLGQLARGGRRDLFYGDPSVLTEADLATMARTRRLFFDAWERGLETCFVGLGEPGRHPWHGWLTGGGHRGLLHLVNWTDHPVRVRLPIVSVLEARALFHDCAAAPAVQVQHDLLTVELPPECTTLIGVGAYADASWGEAVATNDPASLRSARLLDCTWRHEPDGLQAAVRGLQPGERLRVTVEVDEAGPGQVAQGSFRVARQTTKAAGDTMEPDSHKLVRISARQHGRDLALVRRVPEVPIFCGISWLISEFEVTGDAEVSILPQLDPARKLTATLHAVR